MVRIRYKTGTVRSVPGYVAKRLVDRRIADYEPESPQVEQPPAPVVETAAPAEPVETAAPAEPVEQEIDIDALTRDELYDLAVELGFDPHPKLGATKLKALLQ